MTGISLGSSPITGVYVGSTLATGVYLGGTKLWPAASGIVPVGSKATAQTINFGSSQTSQTMACALPSGCLAGDLAVLSCEAQNARGFAWVAPTGAGTALPTTTFGTGAAGLCGVFLYTLTQADVDAGSVGVPCTAQASSSVVATVEVDVRRGVSQTSIDVVGTLATGTLGASPANATAPGINTLRNGDLLQYCLFLTSGIPVSAVTPPANWTGGDPPVLSGTSYAITGYLAQSAAGATGNVSPTVAYNTTAPDYAIVLLALRKKAPAIELTATFPSSLHVGDTGSFVLTATRVDGATGALTITGSPLPDGMSIGSTTDNGDDTFTATATYDLTTEQDITASFGTTGGSVAATALTHEFVVQAAQPGASIVEMQTLNAFSNAPQPLTFTSPIQAGDMILVMAALGTNVSQRISCTDSASNSYGNAATPFDGQDNCTAQALFATAAAASQNGLTLTITPNKQCSMRCKAYLIRGSVAVDSANVVSNIQNDPGGAQDAIGPYATSGRALVFAVVASFQSNATAAPTMPGPDFTQDASSGGGNYRAVLGHAAFGAAVANKTIAVSIPSGTTAGLTYQIVPLTY